MTSFCLNKGPDALGFEQRKSIARGPGFFVNLLNCLTKSRNNGLKKVVCCERVHATFSLLAVKVCVYDLTGVDQDDN